MLIKLYHGSQQIIEAPIWGKGATNNDYGRGYYCTTDIELANEWACTDQGSGYANAYWFEMDGLSVMDLSGPDYNVLNWLALLAKHRTYWQNNHISEVAKAYLQENFLPDIIGVDVIVGYRADDSYFSFARSFVAGEISLRQLKQAMQLGNLGLQYVLKSERAFSNLAFIEATPADANLYYPRRQKRNQDARNGYRQCRTAVADVNDIYMLDILREEMKNEDSRLF